MYRVWVIIVQILGIRKLNIFNNSMADDETTSMSAFVLPSPFAFPGQAILIRIKGTYKAIAG